MHRVSTVSWEILNFINLKQTCWICPFSKIWCFSVDGPFCQLGGWIIPAWFFRSFAKKFILLVVFYNMLWGLNNFTWRNADCYKTWKVGLIHYSQSNGYYPHLYFEFHFACRLVSEVSTHMFSLLTESMDRWTSYGIDGLKGLKIHKHVDVGYFDLKLCQLPCVANRMPHITALKWLWSWRKCLMTS